jgi:3alpha(or 20beta)-hydroxysteroid dehydrogenase
MASGPGRGRLEGKVVLISGGASGIGRAEALLFAAEGAKVVIGDVDEEGGRGVAEEIGEAAEFVSLDIAEEDDWQQAVAVARRRFGDLGAMVGNAGVYGTEPLAGTSPQEWDRIQRVNQRGTFLGIRAVLPVLEARGGGAIVNVSSAAGTRGFPAMFSYGVSKWAIRGIGRYAAVEAAPAGVRVNTILPGVIDTPMQRLNGPDQIEAMRQAIPMRRIGRPEDVAAAALYLISDEALYVTGVELPIDGGALA